jgi:hypothetical protein
MGSLGALEERNPAVIIFLILSIKKNVILLCVMVIRTPNVN